VLPATTPSGRWLFGMRYFVLEVPAPAHRCASVHLFTEISRIRWEEIVGGGWFGC